LSEGSLTGRTFIRRRGRLTRGQRRALEETAPEFLVDPEPGQWPQVFGRTAPMGLEIGFGMGQALIDWAEHSPDLNLVGVEIYRPGIGSALLGIANRELANLRIMEGGAETLVGEKFPAASLEEIRIWFPDPWPKKRHHKRRLIQAPFVAALANSLNPGGVLRLATDWADYAEWIRAVLDGEPRLVEASMEPERVTTRFEARGVSLGHQVWDLAYRKGSN
jgi:tRNA (guanine-N7-)-methyltransferase